MRPISRAYRVQDTTAPGFGASGGAAGVRPHWWSTLSGRLLVALVGFVFVATAAVLGVELARGRRQLLGEAHAALTGRARLVADRLARGIRERQRLVAVWPQLESAQDLAVDDVDKRLAASLAQLAANFADGTLALGFDTAGNVIAASQTRWLGRRVDPEWRASAAVETQLVDYDRRVGGVMRRDRLLIAAAPVRDRASGRPLGTIALVALWPTLVRNATSGIEDMVDVEAGPAELRSPPAHDRNELWGAPVPVVVQGLDAQVTDGLPLATALAPLQETERRLLLLALVVLAITAPAAAVVAGTTTRALNRLTAAALAVRQGGLDAPGPGTAAGSERAPVVAFEDVPAGAPAEVRVLADALLEMVRRLEVSRHELARQESLAALGSMAAVLAHEIRTPLAVLRTSADMLARRVAGDAKGEELVSLLQEETERLSRLASDLLVFARPRAPELAPADLADVAHRAAGILGDRFREAGVALEATPSPAPVRADAEQLTQAALNVLGNALEVSARGDRVQVETGVAEGEAYLRVSDQGPGIEAANLERIWLPFFTTRRGGTGLGLSIVRQILEAHGGRAEIETSPEGTRVTLIVPREEASA